MNKVGDASEINTLRAELRRCLDRADRWFSEEPPLDLGAEPAVDISRVSDSMWLAEARRTIKHLTVRSSSALINVAFVGGFSSGKSFLIGGLQHRVEYEPVISDNEIESARYIGLLYSGPEETTACPATVVPVEPTTEYDASGRGFLRVRFDRSDAWEDIENSPVPAVVAAYTTNDSKLTANRKSARHREQAVAEVEILLAEASLPAKLYDLPGHHSLTRIHDEISKRSWVDADCFVFTTQATQTLGEKDHELITRLHEHHVNSGKQVIWVVTGIDRANEAGSLPDDKVDWQKTIERNNAYLRDHFPSTDGKVNTFAGVRGFLPVSPAWEAKGEWLISRHDGREAQGKNYIAASKMDDLREILADLIENDTGRKHIANIAREARALVFSRYGTVRELSDTARVPLDQLAGEKDDLRRRLDQLRSATPGVRQHLTEDLQVRLRRVDRQFRGLADFLHARLDDEIKKADLMKEREASRIDALKTQLLREWVSGHGPEKVWEAESQAFADTALSAVQVTIGETKPTSGLGAPGAGMDLEQLRVRPSERYRTGAQDIIGQVSKLVGLTTPVVAAIAAAAGLISGPFVIVPAGLTLTAGVVYGLIRRNIVKTGALDLLRQAWIQSVEEAARDYPPIFMVAISGRAFEVIDRVIEILTERSNELTRKILLAERTLAAPDNARRQDLVDRLDPYCQKGKDLLAQMDRLVRP